MTDEEPQYTPEEIAEFRRMELERLILESLGIGLAPEAHKLLRFLDAYGNPYPNGYTVDFGTGAVSPNALPAEDDRVWWHKPEPVETTSWTMTRPVTPDDYEWMRALFGNTVVTITDETATRVRNWITHPRRSPLPWQPTITIPEFIGGIPVYTDRSVPVGEVRFRKLP